MISKLLYLQADLLQLSCNFFSFVSAALKVPYSPIKQKVMFLFNKR